MDRLDSWTGRAGGRPMQVGRQAGAEGGVCRCEACAQLPCSVLDFINIIMTERTNEPTSDKLNPTRVDCHARLLLLLLLTFLPPAAHINIRSQLRAQPRQELATLADVSNRSVGAESESCRTLLSAKISVSPVPVACARAGPTSPKRAWPCRA